MPLLRLVLLRDFSTLFPYDLVPTFGKTAHDPMHTTYARPAHIRIGALYE